MNTQEVADRLVQLCNDGKGEQAEQELYADNILSIEKTQSGTQVSVGLKGKKAKGKQWESMVDEFYGSKASEPLVAGNTFSVKMTMDIKYKGGERMTDEEICVYMVEDGKIIREEFWYKQPQAQR